ncbi:MAG: thiamine pyrophosphate-binding protein [Betaproteobacteria bacterium]|nr:thiamine pyrophosphate-binding protein [Betaproteobacteria bacterium]
MNASDIPAHGGERVAAALAAHGVKFIFTLCGGHISPILVAAKRRGIRIVDTRDEVTAVFAADAVARLTGTPGVAAVTAGPGVTNTITALKNAQMAQSPVLLLGGAAPTALQGRGALQDIDQKPLVAPHVKLIKQVRRVADLGPAVEEALVASLEGVPGPTFVECPVDLLYDEKLIRGWYSDAAGKGTSIADRFLRWYLNRHASRMFAGSDQPYSPTGRAVPVPLAGDGAVAHAADALSKAERPLMVLGSQSIVEAAAAAQVAEAVKRLGVPVYLSGMARGLLGRDSGLQMRHARRKALRESDCVLLAGVPCDFRLDYGKHVRRSATLIAANRSTKDARLNRKPAIEAIGDAGRFITAVAERAGGGAKRVDWIATLHARDAEREGEIDEQARASGAHVNPVAFFRAMDRVAGDNAVFVADGGDFVATASYILRPRGPLAWLDPGAFGTLGVGAGFALGASVVKPQSEVWIVWGDGACGYGLSEFDTFVRHGIPVIAVVGNDAGWTQIAREQVKMLGDDVGTVLARTAYHEVARGFGAAGVEIRTGAEVDAGLAEARRIAATGKPVLVNVWLDKTEFREGSISM